MKKFKFILRFCLALALVLPALLRGQSDRKFSENPSEFVDELGAFMTASKRPDLEESYAVFKKMYKEGRIPAHRMQRVIGMANTLGAQRLAPFPYFKDYINAVNAGLAKSDTTVFFHWHNLADQAIKAVPVGKTKPIAQFMEFSADYMEQNAFKTGEGGSVTWIAKGGQQQFEFKDGEPLLRLDLSDLMGLRKVDSLVIRETSGVYSIYENEWRGTQGKIGWQTAGLDESVYAVLSNYVISAKKPLFTCDSALLFYPLFFPGGPIKGKFEGNIVVENKGAARQYPRFQSFDKSLKINRFGDGIEYVGGFRLWGASVYGYGSADEPARLTVYNKKREKSFYGTGELFIVKREETILAEEIYAKMFMDGDSLFHPATNLRVEIPTLSIHLTRGQKANERNPFFSSFYNMNLDAEKVSMYVNQDSLDIGSRSGTMKGANQKVAFESSNRYNHEDYVRIQNISTKNPIAVLFLLGKESQSPIVSDNAFAKRLNPNFDYSSIQSLMAEMVEAGYVNYYFDRHEIEIREKLNHYALASQGKRDYDAIKIESTSTESNATLNLKTKQTDIRDVENIELSARQHVGVKPDGNALVLLKNRDMRFSGRLFAGFALFHGKDMAFTYDDFKVAFDSVRTLDFYLPMDGKDKKGAPVAEAMNSSVEYVSGVLLVDAPNNKSGKEDLNIFPSLQSKKNSFVYYDQPITQGGAYKRDSFFFKLDPFSFNGLDAYTRADLKFKGEMAPAGIFKPFRETIVVRDEDKSFGYIHKTPPTGYPTYYAKGNYTGEIDLSNKGFLGVGKVEYLTADIESEDIVFKPKQLTCTARKFFMEEDRAGKVKVPQAKGEDVAVNWLPYRDSMYVTSKAKAFELFKASGYTHKGVLVLTPSGLKGNGEFEWSGGLLRSRIIEYGPFQARSDTADLQIKALSGEGIAFDSKNVDGELDFDAQKGQFKANSAEASTSMPLNQYRTSMNEFTWDMKAQTITFKADINKPGFFISTDPKRDSLSFEGKTAFYDLKTSQLKIGGVEVIRSADAFIYPATGDVEIKPGGQMTELDSARIVADVSNQYHTIKRAKVQVEGKKLYKASGYYKYDIPGYEQEIFFKDIVGQRFGPGSMATKATRTTASGEVKEADTFRMDIKTLFQGNIILKANQQNLRFEGYAKLDASGLPGNQWFTVRSDVDKNNPIVEIKNTKNLEDEPLQTGFLLSKELGYVYPRVLLPAWQRTDRVLIDAEGYLTYDEKTDKFSMGDSLKLLEQSQRGSKMVFDNRTGKIQAEGPLNLGAGLKYMKVFGSGTLRTTYPPAEDTTGMFEVRGEFMTGINITLPKGLMEIMLNELKAASFDAPPPTVNTQQAFYQPALNTFIADQADLEESLANLRNNFVTLPKKGNNYSFLLGKHDVIWNEEYQSFITTDDRIPVVSINGDYLNKSLSGYVEYKMPTNDDDRFYLYLKGGDIWYFFGYQAGIMNVVSSSTRFMEVLSGMKVKDTQFKMPDGELYEVVPANPSLANAFIDRVRQGRKRN